MGYLDDAVKADLLAAATKSIDSSASAGLSEDEVHTLVTTYFRHIAIEDLEDRSPADIATDVVKHLRAAAKRPQGTAVIRVRTPEPRPDGEALPSVIEIVTDDMPFIVDSVTMEVSRSGHAIQLVVHPQVWARRNVTGALLGLSAPGATDDSTDDGSGSQVMAESWMRVEIDRVTDADQRRALEERLQHVLRDVREAVEDWPKMQATAVSVADGLAATPPAGLPADEVVEAVELLRWLADNHFTFLGYREYQLVDSKAGAGIAAVPGSGLGILRADSFGTTSLEDMRSEVRSKAREKHLLILTKANSRSTVHRPTYLDYVGVKRFDERGEVIGEQRFLGLFTSAAYIESVLRIPVLRRKTRQVLDRSGYAPKSHGGKDLIEILETYPRDELFQTPVDELTDTVTAVLHLQERRRLRLFVRRDDYGRYVSCLVYLPRDRYTTDVRLAMQRIFTETVGSDLIDFTARVTESVLARLHFVVRMQPGEEVPDLDVERLEADLVEATRVWEDDVADALKAQCGVDEAAALQRHYAGAFPEAYKEDFDVATAVDDIRRLDALDTDAVDLHFYSPRGVAESEPRFKILRRGESLSLSAVLPVLQHMGVEVVDERPYAIDRPGRERDWIYDFGLHYQGREPIDTSDPEDLQRRFQEAFNAAWRGLAESDGFNALVITAGITWRRASVLRAYAKYLRQIGTTFSQDYLEECLNAHVPITRALVDLFLAKFDPAGAGDRESTVAEIRTRVLEALDGVASLDQDRILRSYLALIDATLRTSYFQPGPDGDPKSYVSFKFDPRGLPDLPAPRPRFEIWCYAPRVEGVHLRFGPVARGGLRWSDRREDFRTEVLGLVKAQAVKNAVIVPVGAKGGFVCKRLPDPAVDREAWLAEGIACYRTFISSMLDITDNLVGGKIVPPARVVRHDGDDPYLVVAADKGTATFSDIANAVATDYGFWLGDAFASGGSAGYDHKAMGITARGAWESVKRHFREMGRDCQTEDFTCVGIGDMSGDVFGNGMLLSQHTRLVAAFDHRHVFLDPSPDSATSYAERRRLFDLPRSSWQDYDAALISEGGGVYPRTAKSIPVSPQVRAALGIAGGDDSMAPVDLMRAILLAEVDLFWNGGIGTYVKASTESNTDVGDKANDAIRVNGGDLRCQAVGEGGNLGCTQLGRIEYARNGGRINTDAIDNSAGVDTSDHEVNIKILLDRVVDDGELTVEERNELLASMTDEVAELVLADNYGQNVCIASGLLQGPALLHVHRDYLRELEKAGQLDRALEFLPSERQLTERMAAKEALTGPEYSVLLAYTKMILAGELIDTDLPDDPSLATELVNYFPSALRERYRDRMDDHRLRREIVVTQVVNNVVNNSGVTFHHRLATETGASNEDLVRAHVVAQRVFDMEAIWSAIDALDSKVDATVQTAMRLEGRTITERTARWLVINRRPPIAIQSNIDQFQEGVAVVAAALPDVLVGRERTLYAERRDRLTMARVPVELATTVATLPPAYAALGIVESAQRRDLDPVEVARTHFRLGERLQFGRLLERIIALPREDRWQSMVRAALRDELHATHAALTAQVLDATPEGGEPEARVTHWEEQTGVILVRARSRLHEILDSETWDLARLSVALRVVRTLVNAPM